MVIIEKCRDFCHKAALVSRIHGLLNIWHISQCHLRNHPLYKSIHILSCTKCPYARGSIFGFLNVIHWSISFSLPVPYHTFQFYKFIVITILYWVICIIQDGNKQVMENNEKPDLKETEVREIITEQWSRTRSLWIRRRQKAANTSPEMKSLLMFKVKLLSQLQFSSPRDWLYVTFRPLF